MKLHVVMMSMILALTAGVALGDDGLPATLPTTEGDLAWGRAVTEALGEEPVGPVKAYATWGGFTGSERGLHTFTLDWRVRRLWYRDAAALMTDVCRYGPRRGHVAALQLRGRQLVLVEGPGTEAVHAARVMAAAWSVHCHDEEVQATMVLLPDDDDEGAQSVVTTALPADHPLRQPLEGSLRAMRGAFARDPGCGDQEPEGCAMRIDGHYLEVRSSAVGASGILVSERNQALGRQLLTAIGGRPMWIGRPRTRTTDGEPQR